MYGRHPKVTFDKNGREVSRDRVVTDVSVDWIKDRHRSNPGIVMPGVSLTVQSSADDSDINSIIKRYGVDGALNMSVRTGQYFDVSGMPDYRIALATVARASTAFADLPAAIRKRFSNDPALFVDFMSDSSNLAEAVKLGLLPASLVTAGGNPPAVPPVAVSLNAPVAPPSSPNGGS